MQSGGKSLNSQKEEKKTERSLFDDFFTDNEQFNNNENGNEVQRLRDNSVEGRRDGQP